MTAQTPAPKASSVSALLASLSTEPPPSQPSATDDFSEVIRQAETAQSGAAENTSSAQTAKQTEKPSATAATAAGAKDLSQLLAWLAPPILSLPQLPARKVAASSVPVVPSALEDQNVGEAKTVKEQPPATDSVDSDPMATSLLLALLAPPLPILPQLLSRKIAAPSGAVEHAVPPPPPGPAQSAAEVKPATKDASEKLPPAPIQLAAAKEPEAKEATPSGTSAANTTQRMSFTPERNEIAGRVEQKLPPPAISAVSSADTGGPSSDGGAKSSLAFSWHEAPSESLPIIDLSGQTGSVVAPVAEASVEAPVSAASTAPVERLERIISREVLTIRQSGAETLGVSVKLDSNTQVYLQLTNHNGEVQASVRCERGSFAPEDAQWAQLQQSLARQNIALLPMTGGSSMNFQQSSDKHARQQQAAAREDWPTPGAAVQPAQPRKQKEQNRSRNNWESWA
jgi:hypothetical protein